MRKLASIQRVINLIPIPNADAIELAQINGWQCVVKKGELQVGDVGVYLEIDAVPPESPVFDFLWKGHDQRPASFRIKTIKLRGALSQGLLLPISFFPECSGIEVGSDVTEVLGVTKYEPHARLITLVAEGHSPR
jgi:RNA ligase (TIGR02306 family)